MQKRFVLKGISFTIRPVREKDLEQILDVYRQCEDFLSLGPVATASMEMVLTDLQISRLTGGIFCGIFQGSLGMIGVVDYIPKNFEGKRDCAFIQLLMIAAPRRGKGVGRAVVKLVEDEIIRDSQIKEIQSGVQVNNPHAIKFWESHGYQIISEPISYPDGTTAYSLSKRLAR